MPLQQENHPLRQRWLIHVAMSLLRLQFSKFCQVSILPRNQDPAASRVSFDNTAASHMQVHVQSLVRMNHKLQAKVLFRLQRTLGTSTNF